MAVGNCGRLVVLGSALTFAVLVGMVHPGPVRAQVLGPCSSATSVAVGDADEDGLDDECELSLARRFAPEFVASVEACNWDAPRERLGGANLFAVHPVGDTVRLIYMPAYYDDCGWQGPKCWLRWRGGCDPHHGDSELIMVDVVPSQRPVPDSAAGDAYVPARVFLSAHCFGGSDGRCRWFQPNELEWVGDGPVVWVAEGKNANYPSRGACDSGHWSYDTCDRNATTFRFPVERAMQNVGSPWKPLPEGPAGPGCVSADQVGLGVPDPTGMECIWTSDRFRGWYATTDTEGATGYIRYLRDYAGLVEESRSPK